MAYLICGGSFITSRYRADSDRPNYEAVIYHPWQKKLLHGYRINHADEFHNKWELAVPVHVKTITQASPGIEAAGPGAIIDSTFGASGSFHVIAAERQQGFIGLAHYASDNNSAGILGWRRLGVFADGATAGDLLQNRITQKLEAVALIGRSVYHFEGTEHGAWVLRSGPITANALAPPTLTQTSYSDNLELVIPVEGRGLVHYVRAASGGTWTEIATITTRVTGIAGFRQGPHGDGVHKNFEVAVPFHDRVEFFWRDNGDPLAPWKSGGIVTRDAGPVNAVALASTPYHDGVELLTQEPGESIFHYYRYVEDDGRRPWIRTSCLKIDEGPYQNMQSKGPFGGKINQVTGEIDRESNEATRTALHNPNLNMLGTDLGSSFTHGGRLYFLFGDTHWHDGEPPGNADSIAYAVEGSPSQGLTLEFHRSYMHIVWDRVWDDLRLYEFEPALQGEFDVPQDGFSHEGNLFAFFSTNHGMHGKTMGRSVLTRCLDDVSNFAPTDADDPLIFLCLTEFSRRRFINIQVLLTTPEIRRTFKVDSEEPGLLIWGSGAYRADNVYLAFLPFNQHTLNILMGRSASAEPLRPFYFAGLHGSEPVWSTLEEDATPLFHPAAVGELSVRYDQALRAFVMMYMSGSWDQIGEAVCLRLSRTPYGPWSIRRKVFDVPNEGFGKFIQHPNIGPTLGDSIIKNRDVRSWGGAYAPYQIPTFTRKGFGKTYLIYYVLSTWNPYQVVLMVHAIMLSDRDELLHDRSRLRIRGVSQLLASVLDLARAMFQWIIQGVARVLSTLADLLRR